MKPYTKQGEEPRAYDLRSSHVKETRKRAKRVDKKRARKEGKTETDIMLEKLYG
jgi:hypothetical protein